MHGGNSLSLVSLKHQDHITKEVFHLSKSKKHSPGYETSDLISAVKQQVLTGKATSQLLFEIPLPHKSAHFLKKARVGKLAAERWHDLELLRH